MDHINSNEVTMIGAFDCTYFLHAWQPQEKCVKLNGGNRCEKVPQLIKQLHDGLISQDEIGLAKAFIVEYKKIWRLIKTAVKAKLDFDYDYQKLHGNKITVEISGTALDLGNKAGMIVFRFKRLANAS